MATIETGRGWKEYIPNLVVSCGLRTTETSGLVRENKIALRQVQHIMRMTIPYDVKIEVLLLIFGDGYGSFTFTNQSVVETISDWFLHGTGKSRINISDYDYIKINIPKYTTDDHYGLCNDGDTRCIRVVRDEDGYECKIRLGKVLSKYLAEQNEKARGIYCHTLNTKLIPVSEIFCLEALTYVSEKICNIFAAYVDKNSGFELIVNDDFQAIYSSKSWVDYHLDSDSAHSCMRNKDEVQPFYRAAGCKAAGLWKNGKLFARCVVYQNVYERSYINGRKAQDTLIGGVAERQYAINQEGKYMQMLVDKLYEGGYITYHKRVGTSCWNHDDFVDSKGNHHHYLYVKTSWTPKDDYPFVDGFCYATADKNSCELATWRYGRYSQLELDNTSTNMGDSVVFSKYIDRWLHESDTQWSEVLNDYLPCQDCYWSEDDDTYMPLEC